MIVVGQSHFVARSNLAIKFIMWCSVAWHLILIVFFVLSAVTKTPDIPYVPDWATIAIYSMAAISSAGALRDIRKPHVYHSAIVGAVFALRWFAYLVRSHNADAFVRMSGIMLLLLGHIVVTSWTLLYSLTPSPHSSSEPEV